jgi:cell division protein DivIC
MKRSLKYLKNKYIFTTCVFVLYFLFLDDTDVFTLINHNRKLNHLEASKLETSQKLDSTLTLLKRLRFSSELESYAREKKFFKKENEDIFVISRE